jgi:hypothetical protein
MTNLDTDGTYDEAVAEYFINLLKPSIEEHGMWQNLDDMVYDLVVALGKNAPDYVINAIERATGSAPTIRYSWRLMDGSELEEEMDIFQAQHRRDYIAMQLDRHTKIPQRTLADVRNNFVAELVALTNALIKS